jgi:transcription antitermination protein NusB
MRGLPATEVLAARAPALAADDYARQIVAGVGEHAQRIDDLLTSYSVGWTIDRMPSVDRNILRIGIYEIVYNDAVPDAVAVSEAVELAQSLSTDESAAFVNGLLARVIEMNLAP